MLNESFQITVEEMLVDFQCSKDNGSMVIHRGPVKAADRVQTKAETNYSKESFPSAAKVVDILR